jgi:hypothetical protein
MFCCELLVVREVASEDGLKGSKWGWCNLPYKCDDTHLQILPTLYMQQLVQIMGSEFMPLSGWVMRGKTVPCWSSFLAADLLYIYIYIFTFPLHLALS